VFGFYKNMPKYHLSISQMVVFQKSLTTFSVLSKSLFPDAEFDPFNFTKKSCPNGQL
jgi:hypothetical protein